MEGEGKASWRNRIAGEQGPCSSVARAPMAPLPLPLFLTATTSSSRRHTAAASLKHYGAGTSPKINDVSNYVVCLCADGRGGGGLSRSELLAGSDDFAIRAFREEEVIAEITEADKVLALASMGGKVRLAGGRQVGHERRDSRQAQKRLGEAMSEGRVYLRDRGLAGDDGEDKPRHIRAACVTCLGMMCVGGSRAGSRTRCRTARWACTTSRAECGGSSPSTPVWPWPPSTSTSTECQR